MSESNRPMESGMFSFLVQDIVQELPDVRRYRFDYGLTPFEFYAGQFCVVKLPGSEPALTGALSLASSPLRRDSFDLVVKRTGNFGTRFYDGIGLGEVISMKPPMGRFVLSTNNPQPVTAIGFDYCVTAIRSFWQYLEDTQEPREFNFIHVIRGARNALFQSEFSASAQGARHYLPVEREEGEGVFGLKEIAELVPNVGDHQVFVVGEGEDVRPLVEEWKRAGLNERSLHVERWS